MSETLSNSPRDILLRTDPRITSRVITGMSRIVIEMMHEGKITPEEANRMYQKTYDPRVVAQEVQHYKRHRGIMPLTSQTARLKCFQLKTAPTEEPK